MSDAIVPLPKGKRRIEIRAGALYLGLWSRDGFIHLIKGTGVHLDSPDGEINNHLPPHPRRFLNHHPSRNGVSATNRLITVSGPNAIRARGNTGASRQSSMNEMPARAGATARSRMPARILRRQTLRGRQVTA